MHVYICLYVHNVVIDEASVFRITVATRSDSMFQANT